VLLAGLTVDPVVEQPWIVVSARDSGSDGNTGEDHADQPHGAVGVHGA
jgi:hypothetical protein